MRTERKQCPVCRGAGTKGHGFWNVLSDCFACAGTGKVEVHQRRRDRHAENEWRREIEAHLEARS